MNVSFVIPCYSSLATILKTVQSIVNQSHPIFEIIVVINGPDDGTSNALKTFPQVRTLQLPLANRSLARNAGASVARGPLIAFVDSDVVLDSAWLSNAVNSFRNNTFIDILSTTVIPAGDEKELLFQYRNAYRSWLSRGSFLSIVKPTIDGYTLSPVINTAACVCRKQLFESAGGFDPQFKREEDAEFSLRAYLAGAALYAEKKSVSYVYSGSTGDTWFRYLRRYAELGLSSAKFTRKWKINGPSLKLQMLARFYRHSRRLDLALIFVLCKLIHVLSYLVSKAFVPYEVNPSCPTNYALLKSMQVSDGSWCLALNSRILATDSQIQVELLGTREKIIFEGDRMRTFDRFLRTGQLTIEDLSFLKEKKIIIDLCA